MNTILPLPAANAATVIVPLLYFFRCFFIVLICNSFSIILLSIFWNFCDIPLLYYHLNLKSSITSCHFSADMSFFRHFFIILMCNFFVILSAILLSIKSPVACAFFCITLFEEVLSASVADFLAWSGSVWLHLPLKFLLIFLPIFLKTKIHSLL